MKNDVLVHNAMTLCPLSVGLNVKITEASLLMDKHNIRHLPVEDKGNLVGIISDRDIKNALGWVKSAEEQLTVNDIYVPEPYIVAPNSYLSEVLNVMADRHLGCALVAIKHDKLVGIFTTTDACRYLAKMLSKEN